MILAQATPGLSLRDVMDYLGWLAAIIVAVIAYLTYNRKREHVTIDRIDRQPLKTRKVEPNVKEPACIERRAAIQKQLDDLEGYTKEEVGRIHDKIDDVESRFQESLRKSIGEVNRTLQDMPMTIVALINGTAKIKRHNEPTNPHD